MPAPPETTDTASDGSLSPPSKLLLLLEGRAAGELLTSVVLRRWLRRQPHGDGHPVLILPGFLATDFSTRPLRRFLRDLGYPAHRWKLGRNLGPRDGLELALAERLRELHRRHQRRVSLIGWSLGGVYARALANRQPRRVRSVITLGSPFARDTKANNSWRLYEAITGERLAEIDPQRLAAVRRTPPAPTTSIYSRSDGVANWRSALQAEGPLSESVQVPGSHLGLGFNPLVLYVVADRLSQPVDGWQPFFRSGKKHPPGIRRPPAEATSTGAPKAGAAEVGSGE